MNLQKLNEMEKTLDESKVILKEFITALNKYKNIKRKLD